MIQQQRCCAHCPGNPMSSLNRREHICSVPTYISGNLKLSALKKSIPGNEERTKRLQKKPAVNRDKSPDNYKNMFSIAKKFHAENLQHQPLPDRIEDGIFTNSQACDKSIKCPCMQDMIERCRNIEPKCNNEKSRLQEKYYGPVLGCKKPESHMDLAICWETPIDPVYEPRKPTHVDGSNGGAAPAVFTLVQHKKNNSCGCINQVSTTFCSDYCGDKNEDTHQAVECCRCCRLNQRSTELVKLKEEKNIDMKENETGNPSNELCDNLDSIYISKHVCGKMLSKPSSAQNAKRSKYSRQLRHCTACDEKKKQNAESMERSQSAGCFLQRFSQRNDRRNGLPAKGMLVPRPKTPFARRSFCIDTLTPPFSVINGSRDADYPEHWRLASVYQQSYRHPRKQRGTILTYNR